MKILNPDQSVLMGRARAALREHGFESHYAKTSSPGHGDLLTIRGHGKTRSFLVEERRTLNPSLGVVGSVIGFVPTAARFKGFGVLSESPGTLFVTESIDAATAAALWSEGINFLDAAGNASIDLGGLRVEVGGRRGDGPKRDGQVQKHALRAPEMAAFSAAGLPVSLLLMSRPDLVASDPTLRQLADLVPSSLGKVHEVVKALQSSGYLTFGKGGRVIEGQRMLSAWTEGYLRHRHKWHGELRHSTPDERTGAHVDLAVLTAEGVWLGGEAAAGKMAVQLRPTSTLIYADKSRASALIRQLKLRPDRDGSIEIAQPLWAESAWQRATAPSVLIRADLLASGDPRQAEAAEEMMTRDEDIRRLLGR